MLHPLLHVPEAMKVPTVHGRLQVAASDLLTGTDGRATYEKSDTSSAATKTTTAAHNVGRLIARKLALSC